MNDLMLIHTQDNTVYASAEADRLERLAYLVRRDWYASQAIPERDPLYRLPAGTLAPTVTASPIK
jgi:hypothetical protein